MIENSSKVPWALLLSPDGSTLYEKEVNYDQNLGPFNPINIAVSSNFISIVGNIWIS